MQNYIGLIGIFVSIITLYFTVISAGTNSNNNFEKKYIESRTEKNFKIIIMFFLTSIFSYYIHHKLFYGSKLKFVNKEEFINPTVVSIVLVVYLYTIYKYLLVYQHYRYYRIVDNEKQYYYHYNLKMKIVYLKLKDSEHLITDSIENDIKYIKYKEVLIDRTLMNLYNKPELLTDSNIKIIIYFCLNITFFPIGIWMFYYEYIKENIEMLLYPLSYTILLYYVAIPYLFLTIKELLKRRKQNKAPTQQSE